MKNLLIISIALLSLASCKAKKSVENADTLPKDISLKPENNMSQQEDQQALSALIKEIDAIIATEPCADPAEWKFSAIGAKPCGGPSSYVAYPVKLEDEILPRIERFTAMQSAFNTKYNLMSDCAMVMPPSEIRCENGKAVLVRGNSEVSEAQ
ncbi:MAG: hypothetical protein ACXWBY_04675 [Kaistella sp.]